MTSSVSVLLIHFFFFTLLCNFSSLNSIHNKVHVTIFSFCPCGPKHTVWNKPTVHHFLLTIQTNQIYH